MKKLDFSNSRGFLARSKRCLAAASTFSKVNQFGDGKTPFCVVKGDGARTWDVDGNEYIDYIIGLGCVTLGHNHPVVTRAIEEQLENGISFSLPTPLEVEVAEMLIARIPSAEMVRFGKNGNDVTSAAIRISRYHTGRDHVLFCGYHGWQDWYISKTSMNGGIPDCVGKLSHRFVYNDIDTVIKLVREFKENIACIILEPVAKEWPKDNFLEKVREIASKEKIVLIFDEIVTGFRFHKAGIQAMMGVTPDLSCFGKAMANGMPVSALVGKGEIMSKFNKIFFSLTNAGETLSLAVAKAVIDYYDKVDVPGCISGAGKKLRAGIEELIKRYELAGKIRVSGFNCRNGLVFSDKSVSKFDTDDELLKWTRLVTSHGILSGGGHMISYSHNDDIVKETMRRYEDIFESYAEGRAC